jgi:hypothetical protein
MLQPFPASFFALHELPTAEGELAVFPAAGGVSGLQAHNARVISAIAYLISNLPFAACAAQLSD